MKEEGDSEFKLNSHPSILSALKLIRPTCEVEKSGVSLEFINDFTFSVSANSEFLLNIIMQLLLSVIVFVIISSLLNCISWAIAFCSTSSLSFNSTSEVKVIILFILPSESSFVMKLISLFSVSFILFDLFVVEISIDIFIWIFFGKGECVIM